MPHAADEHPASTPTPSPPPQLAPEAAAPAQPDAQAPPSPRQRPSLLPASPAEAPPPAAAAAAADPGAAADVQGPDAAPNAGAADCAAAAAAPVSRGDTSTAGITAPAAQQLRQDVAGPAAAQAECPQDAAAAPESAVPGHTSDRGLSVQGGAAVADAAAMHNSHAGGSQAVNGGQPTAAEAVDVPVALALPAAGDTLLPSLQRRQQQLAPLRVPSEPAEQHLQMRCSPNDAAHTQTTPQQPSPPRQQPPRQQQQQQHVPPPEQLQHQQPTAQLTLIPPEERHPAPAQAPQQRQQRQGHSRPAGGSSGTYLLLDLLKTILATCKARGGCRRQSAAMPQRSAKPGVAMAVPVSCA